MKTRKRTGLVEGNQRKKGSANMTTIFDKVIEPKEERVRNVGAQMASLSAKLSTVSTGEAALVTDDLFSLLEQERRNALLRDYARRAAYAEQIISTAT